MVHFDRLLNNEIEPEKQAELIIMEEYDPSKVNQLYLDFYKEIPKEEDIRQYVYTPTHIGSEKHMGLFGDFAPSIIYAINKNNKRHFPFRESNLQEFAHSKLSHLYCTIDKSIMFRFFNKHTARSKVNNLNSVATIMGKSELTLDAEVTEKEDLTEKEIANIMFQVKKNATRLLKYVEISPDLLLQRQAKTTNYKYVDAIKEKFGDNLASILLYGSSAKGTGSDYDNLVFLKTIPDNLYDQILGWNLEEKGKEVGIIFVPEYAMENFLYINVSNTLFKDHAKVLHGTVTFPFESDRYIIFKESYHAGFGSGKLISGINLVYKLPEVLLDKPGLFEYFMKLNRFTYHGLNMKDGYKILSKEEIQEEIKSKFDYEIPKFRPDPVYIQECFLEANKISIDIAKDMYSEKLAREKNERLITIDKKYSRHIFKAKTRGKNVYVFRGQKPLKEKDTVPVVLVKPDEIGYKRKYKSVMYHTNGEDKDFLIAQRV